MFCFMLHRVPAPSRHWGKLIVMASCLSFGVTVFFQPNLRSQVVSAGKQALVWAGIVEPKLSAESVYWCPMHPKIKSNKPNAVCSLCNMALVLLEEGKRDDPTHLTLSRQQIQQAGVVYQPVIPRKLYREIDTTGRIGYDERRLSRITSWIRGKSRISKLHVNFQGTQVSQGELLAELYSPELIQAQSDYLTFLKAQASRSDSGMVRTTRPDFLRGARRNLLDQGFPAEQIDELAKTRQILDPIPIYAQTSGTVIRRHVQEGDWIDAGEVLFEIADLSQLWVFADIYEDELQLVEVGQPVTISVQGLAGKMFEGTVAFIDPVLQNATRTVRVRIDVPNPDGQLKPDMYVRVQFRRELGERLAVPANAVLWSGQRQVVIVKLDDGTFQPREVRIRPVWLHSDAPNYQPGGKLEFGADQIRFHEVLTGLAPGEQVVTSGAFLLNAESQFQSVLTKMLPPQSDAATLEEAIGQALAERLRTVLDSYYDLTHVLAEDQLALVPEQAESLARGASNLQQQAEQENKTTLAQQARRLAELARKLTREPKDLHEARVGFGRVSRDLVQLLAQHGGQTLLGQELFIFRCGMAKVGYENWLWWSPEKFNPYMGQKMLDCGKQLKTLMP